MILLQGNPGCIRIKRPSTLFGSETDSPSALLHPHTNPLQRWRTHDRRDLPLSLCNRSLSRFGCAESWEWVTRGQGMTIPELWGREEETRCFNLSVGLTSPAEPELTSDSFLLRDVLPVFWFSASQDSIPPFSQPSGWRAFWKLMRKQMILWKSSQTSDKAESHTLRDVGHPSCVYKGGLFLISHHHFSRCHYLRPNEGEINPLTFLLVFFFHLEQWKKKWTRFVFHSQALKQAVAS